MLYGMTTTKTTAKPCMCWYGPAVLHSGHCCFGIWPGETMDDSAARWARYDAGIEDFCHPIPEGVETGPGAR